MSGVHEPAATARGTTAPELQERIERWKRETFPAGLRQLGLTPDDVEPKLATPLDVEGGDYLRDVGLPGE